MVLVAAVQGAAVELVVPGAAVATGMQGTGVLGGGGAVSAGRG
jgi:hypothetical protein